MLDLSKKEEASIINLTTNPAHKSFGQESAKFNQSSMRSRELEENRK
jgi:hypothetical protein